MRDGRTDRRMEKVKYREGAAPKNLKKPTLSIASAGPQDIEYLYYPLHVEGVTLKGLLLPANIR